MGAKCTEGFSITYFTLGGGRRGGGAGLFSGKAATVDAGVEAALGRVLEVIVAPEEAMFSRNMRPSPSILVRHATSSSAQRSAPTTAVNAAGPVCVP
jgi:hypothetical protein